MAIVKIRKSVGKKGKNAVDDVKKIQELLNTHASKAGFKKLTVDMDAGKKTIGAIETFQKKVLGMSRPDGRIDPGGGTIAALNAKPGTAPAAAEEPKGGSGSSSTSSSKSKSGGKSGGKGTRDLKTVEKELEAVGKKYMEAGDRFKAANQQIAEATEDHHRYLEAKLEFENLETRLKGAIKLAEASIRQAQEALQQEDETKKLAAVDKVVNAGLQAQRCVEDLGVGPQQAKDYQKCTAELKVKVKDVKTLLEDRSKLDTIEKLDRVVAKLEKVFAHIYRVLKVLRGIFTAAMAAFTAKKALFEKGAEAAEKDMKKLQKEMDRLSDEREKLMKKA